MSRDTMNDDFDDEDIEWDETEPNGAEADEDDDAAPIETMVHDGLNALEFDFDDEDAEDGADEDEQAEEDDELASTLND